MIKSFLKSLGASLLLTDGLVLLFFVQDNGAWLSRGQTYILLLLSFLPFATALLLRLSINIRRSVQSPTLCGLAIGFGLPLLGGALLFAFASGFESPAILGGAFMFSIPNALGGAVAGWIQGKSAPAS